MSKTEKENRINSLAVTFLERQQIVPNLYADQIIRGYKEGYHQAEKDLALTLEDINTIIGLYNDLDDKTLCSPKRACKEILKQFKERKEK